MPETIRTDYELYVEKLLRYLNIPHFISHIVCFQCSGAHFYFSSNDKPYCKIGLHEMNKGSFIRPDFIIDSKRYPMVIQTHTEGYDPCRYSILRIDGEVHNKLRVIKRDKAQEKELERLNIPFFVTENYFWKWYDVKTGKYFAPDPFRFDYKKIPARHLDYLLGMWIQTIQPDIYQKYQKIKEIEDSKF